MSGYQLGYALASILFPLAVAYAIAWLVARRAGGRPHWSTVALLFVLAFVLFSCARVVGPIVGI